MPQKKEQSELERKLEDLIYTNRLLVLLEDNNGFNQVRLNPTQFKKVSDAICIKTGRRRKDGTQPVWVSLGRQISKEPFELMEDFYEE